MIIDSVPGLTIHEHEGRLAGTFELPPADLAAIEFNGRIMLVIVADVGAPFRVTTDLKEDINTAHWTMKSVDAAIVRSDSLRDHLIEALHLDGSGVDIVPEEEDDEVEETDEAWSASEETLESLSETVTETPMARIVEPEEDYVPSGPAPNAPKPATPPPDETVERKERFGAPIRHQDATLAQFLDDDRDLVGSRR